MFRGHKNKKQVVRILEEQKNYISQFFTHLIPRLTGNLTKLLLAIRCQKILRNCHSLYTEKRSTVREGYSKRERRGFQISFENSVSAKKFFVICTGQYLSKLGKKRTKKCLKSCESVKKGRRMSTKKSYWFYVLLSENRKQNFNFEK